MSHIESVINNMVEINVDGDDGFRKVKETLTRMGVPSKNEKKLFQSVHILHKRGKYYLCHFKELYILDGRSSTLSEGDIARRNRIVKMMVDWNLVMMVSESELTPMGKSSMVKVIKHSEKDEWTTLQKYAIGVKKRS